VNCPICAHALEGGELVMVCHPCHKALGGGLHVNATGEFRVPTAAELVAASEGELRADAAPLQVVATCAWCGKLETEVQKPLGRAGVAQCDECVSLASDIMEAELGTDWR
jgi:hypothetical protein